MGKTKRKKNKHQHHLGCYTTQVEWEYQMLCLPTHVWPDHKISHIPLNSPPGLAWSNGCSTPRAGLPSRPASGAQVSLTQCRLANWCSTVGAEMHTHCERIDVATRRASETWPPIHTRSPPSDSSQCACNAEGLAGPELLHVAERATWITSLVSSMCKSR